MKTQFTRVLGVLLGLLAAVALAACDEKRVDRAPSAGDRSAASAPQGQAGALKQAQDRAQAAAQRLAEAQAKESTDQEKEDAARQYEAERQAVANGSDQQNGSTGDTSPPPQ
jgi:hypothetical protein